MISNIFMPTLEFKHKYAQILMQLHDTGLISTRTLLREMGLDWDAEFARLQKEFQASQDVQSSTPTA